MRNWIIDARSYMRPIDIGEPMRAAGIGRVIASRSRKVVTGDLVCSITIIKYSIIPSTALASPRSREMVRVADHWERCMGHYNGRNTGQEGMIRLRFESGSHSDHLLGDSCADYEIGNLEVDRMLIISDY